MNAITTQISFRSNSKCLYFYNLNKDFDTYHSCRFQANSSLNDEESLCWIVRVVHTKENAYVQYHKFSFPLFPRIPFVGNSKLFPVPVALFRK